MKSRRRLWRRILGSVLLGVCTAGAASDNVLRAYPLHNPDASTMIEVIRATVGEDVRVLHDRGGQQLLILATSNEHSQVAALMDVVNVTPPNVRVDVVFNDTGESRQSGAGVTGSGRVVVSPQGTRSSFRLTPRLENRTVTRNSTTTQTLLVQSGAEASLVVGTEVPYVEWLVEYGRRWGYMVQHMEMQRVGAYLSVQPRVIGTEGLVHLRLVPELSGWVGDRRESIRYERVASEVTVRSGQTMTLGGLSEHSEFFDRFLVGFDRQGQQRHLEISVTPTVVPAAGP